MGEEVIEKVPNLECPQLLFELSLPNDLVANKQQLKQKLVDAITVDCILQPLPPNLLFFSYGPFLFACM